MTDMQELPHEKYQELLNQEGDTVPLYLVAALHFQPPRPLTDKDAEKRAEQGGDDVLPPHGMQDEFVYSTALLLNVNDVYFHKEYDGSVVFILPADLDAITYEMLNTLHPEHGAWAYRIEPRNWNPYIQDDDDEPMSDAHWYFKPMTVPDFEMDKELTH